MNRSIKRLAGHTAIYGLSSIVGRLLNYLLVPLYTHYFLTHEFGVVVEMYSYVAFLIVMLTYGMETAFFRFSQWNKESNRDEVFSTTLISILTTSVLFIIFTSVYRQDIATLIRYPEHPEYILWFGIIVGLDALATIPFARLRAENKPLLFALIRLTSIGINIIFVLFFIVFCPWAINSDLNWLAEFVETFYNPAKGVAYVFISNLIASIATILLLLPVMLRARLKFSFSLWRVMILYALPLMIAGMAGVVNETIDRLLLKYLLPESIAMSHLGIYGASYKVSVLMVLFIQAFRFAADPFFFAEYKKSNSAIVFARVMKIFVITCMVIFLGIMLFMDIVQNFIGRDFRGGLQIVPVLLIAHVFLGIYFNLSIWYKLTGKTQYGAIITLIGAVITISLNLLLIPIFGFEGAAWVHLVCYFTMATVSYFMGQKHFRVPYDVTRIMATIILAVVIYGLSLFIPDLFWILEWVIRGGLILSFLGFVVLMDREAWEGTRNLIQQIVVFVKAARLRGSNQK